MTSTRYSTLLGIFFHPVSESEAEVAEDEVKGAVRVDRVKVKEVDTNMTKVRRDSWQTEFNLQTQLSILEIFIEAGPNPLYEQCPKLFSSFDSFLKM